MSALNSVQRHAILDFAKDFAARVEVVRHRHKSGVIDRPAREKLIREAESRYLTRVEGVINTTQKKD